MVQGRIKFLSGAPVAAQLQWSENELATSFLPSLKRFLRLEADDPSTTFLQSQSMSISNWRHVPIGGKLFYESPAITRRVAQSTQWVPFNRYEFLEYSFAVLDNLQSSQIEPQGLVEDEEETTFITTTSFSTIISDDTELSGNTSLLSPPGVPIPVRQPVRIPGSITNIKSIPNADSLNQLRPQTMTVNLVVGVISIAPAKTVNVRRGNYAMDVIEMLVGDETKTGFSISTWLTPFNPQSNVKDEMRQNLQGLTSGDVILIERLALSTFRDQVFGQSLNRKTTKNITRFVTLRSDSAQEQDGVPSSVTSKIRRVHDWVNSFVGPSRKRRAELDQARSGRRAVKGQHAAIVMEEALPPDTP